MLGAQPWITVILDAFTLEMNRNHFVIFELAPKYCNLHSFVDYEGYSISFKGFLPTVIDIIVTWSKLSILVHFSALIPKMSMFTLVISSLTTSNLPWFRELTFQVPMQHYSLQHWTFLLPPETSTTGCCFCVSSASYFLLELFLLSSPVEYTDLGSSSFTVISFCLFILFLGFSRQECWSGLPFPSPVNNVLSEPSTMTPFSWVALHSMAHSFIELDKSVVCVISLFSLLIKMESYHLSVEPR